MNGALAAGIPGTPAGLAWLAERYGHLPLATSLGPAMRARCGWLRGRCALRGRGALSRQAAARPIPPPRAYFSLTVRSLRPATLCGSPSWLKPWLRWQPGAAMASTRERWRGAWSRVCRWPAGIWELDDLAGYRVVEREPARITYRGAQITCASLPSSGGLVLTEVLQILERYPLAKLSRPQRDHFVVEALRRGYQDRARYMGDPGFVTPPAALSTPCLCRGARSIHQRRQGHAQRGARSRCTRSFRRATTPRTSRSWTRRATGWRPRSASTCRSVQALVAGDTGVLLNDEMNDFAVGGSQANAYRPGRWRGQRRGARQAAAVQHDADLPRGRPRCARVRHAGRVAHHLHGAAEHPRVRGQSAARPRARGRRTALSSPVSAGPRAVRAATLRYGARSG